MAYDWNAAFEDDPGGTDNPSSGDDEIRKLKTASRERLAKEHVWTTGIGAFAAHGWHKRGSAVAFWTTAAPTLLPDGSTALSAGTLSKGRIWVNASSKNLAVWDGGSFVGVQKEITRVSIQGTLVTGTLGVPIVFPRTVALSRIYARCRTRPVTAGQPVTVDLHRYSISANTSIFSSPGKRLMLSTGTSFCLRTSGQMSMTKITINPTNYLLLQIDAAGGTSRGTDLAVVIEAIPK